MMAAKHRLVLLLAIALLVLASASPVDAAIWEYANYTEDYVDQISDLHPADTDIGTHSDFAEMQDKDGTFDTLTEENTGGAGGSEWISVNAWDQTYDAWDIKVGADPWVDAQDEPTNYMGELASGDVQIGWFDFPSTTLEGTLTVNISIYCRNEDGAGNDRADPYVDYTGSGSGSDVGDVAQHTGWQYDTIDLGSHSVAEVNALRVYFQYVKSGGGDDVLIDHVRIGVSAAGGDNYDLDLEVGWTTADYDETEEYLCIFGGTQGSEALRVDVWDGSWTNVITDLVAGWNNVSVASYLTDATFEIRFTDTTGDAVEADTWQVEAVLLQTWSYAYTAEWSETIGIADTGYPSLDLSHTFYDAIGLADTEQLAIARSNIYYEAIGLADTIYTVFNGVRIFYESIGVAETVLPAASFVMAFFEAVGVASALVATKLIQKTFYESIGIADTIATAFAASKTFFESIGIAGTKHLAADYVVTLSESIGTAGAAVLAASKSRTLFESIGLADIVNATLIPGGGTDYVKYLFESIGVAGTITTALAVSNSFYESIGIAASSSAAASLTRIFSETIGIAGSHFAAIPTDYVKTFFESIGLANTPDVGLVIQSGGDATGIIPTATTPTTTTDDSDVPPDDRGALTVFYIISLMVCVIFLIKSYRERVGR